MRYTPGIATVVYVLTSIHPTMPCHAMTTAPPRHAPITLSRPVQETDNPPLEASSPHAHADAHVVAMLRAGR